jgi:hypothetical protein
MNRAGALTLRAALGAMALSALLVSSVAAAPLSNGAGGPGGDLQLTATQRQNVATKEALARQEEIRPGFAAGKSAGTRGGGTTTGIETTAMAASSFSDWGRVTVYPRRQIKSYFCGVATIQVISNYSWAMGASQDKYSQQYISDAWTATDYYGQTTAWYEAVGLQNATIGSPRLPSNFTYYYKRETSPSTWHADLRTDVTYFRMPMATSVAPKDPGFAYVLATWASPSIPAQYSGHWIVLNGWDGVWDGTRGPGVNFADSGVGSSGTAGFQAAYDMWQIINKANSNHAAGYVVW